MKSELHRISSRNVCSQCNTLSFGQDVVAVDTFSKNDLFVKMTFEQAPDGYASNLWKYRSPVLNEAGSQGTWEVDGMEHIVTHSENVRWKKIKFELWDKNQSESSSYLFIFNRVMCSDFFITYLMNAS